MYRTQYNTTTTHTTTTNLMSTVPKRAPTKKPELNTNNNNNNNNDNGNGNDNNTNNREPKICCLAKGMFCFVL